MVILAADNRISGCNRASIIGSCRELAARGGKEVNLNAPPAVVNGVLLYPLAAVPAFVASRNVASKKIQYAARNSDSNAAITRFSLEIMSTQGSYIYSSEEWPFLKNRGDLYRDVQKYCIDSGDDLGTWFKHNCIVLLGASEFARGISTPGCAFPVTFTMKARFENHRNYVDGHACAFNFGCGLGTCRDIISGNPIMGFIYPQQSLQVSASSALLSSQNISHSSGMELLSRGS